MSVFGVLWSVFSRIWNKYEEILAGKYGPKKLQIQTLFSGIEVIDVWISLRSKCPYSEFCGPYFPAFGLNTERYLRENTDQKIFKYKHFFRITCLHTVVKRTIIQNSLGEYTLIDVSVFITTVIREYQKEIIKMLLMYFSSQLEFGNKHHF